MSAIDYFAQCLGFRTTRDSDREPLLPKYNDDTVLQRELHQKLHSYQQFQALLKGFMPSTEQTIINLRTLLSSDVLNEQNPDLSESGRKVVRYTRQWIQQFSELLRKKNERDQIQDLIWFLSKSRAGIDTKDLAIKAKASKGRADTIAAYQSLKTVGSLVLMNNDFRTFLADLNVVGREVFKDSAFKLSEAAHEAGKKVEPPEQHKQVVAQPGKDKEALGAPSGHDLAVHVAEVSYVVANGTAEVAKTAAESAKERLEGDEGKTLLNRLKQTVLDLRQRKDYGESVSIISQLIQRYALVYSRVASEVGDAAAENTWRNEELDRAVKNAWAFISSFGSQEDWQRCEELWKQVTSHAEKDPEFESMMMELGETVQKMLMDPAFFDEAPQKIEELKEKSKEIGQDTTLHEDVQALLQQLDRTFKSVLQDEEVNNLLRTTHRLLTVLSPPGKITNPDLVQDSIHVFIPLLVSAIQYLPIPRLEVSTPQIDLLLENLILEPGTTVNKSSFFPYRLRVETYNDIDIYRTHTLQTATAMTNLVTVKLDGFALRADEVGFWMRAHTGILRLADEGIASFALDDRGIDIHVDVEIARERMEQILTLKAVRVHIHKLNYTVRKSKFSWLGFLLKPLLRPIFRKTLESQLASALTDFFHAANRELLFARERLRATRVADPDDLITFFKAVAARLTPADDPEMYSRVGVAQPGKGVFKGVYAPGSAVKVWEREGRRAGERVEEFDAGGWRNEIFDTHVQLMT